MAIDTLATRQRVIGIKLESTQGTAVSLTGTDATSVAFDPEVTWNIPFNQRPSPNTATQMAGIPGARSGEFTFRTHLYNSGSGTAPAIISTNLLACGFRLLTGSTYSPITGSSSASTVTVGRWIDGRQERIAGAMGNVVIRGVAGNPIDMNWRFLGKWVAPAADANPTPTYVTTTTASVPRFAGATITIGGTSYKVSEFELDMGNTLTLVPDANASDATGYAWCVAYDRNPTLKCKIMGVALGTIDWYSGYVSGTEYAFSCAVGSGTNNVVTIAAPKLQQNAMPQVEDNGGYVVDSLSFQLNKSAAGGDDELTVALS